MEDAGYLRVALVFLAAAVVVVPLAKRLGLGAVLGYLAAGCIVGPWGLGLVRDVETILHFAELGVVLMLFVIGLELEPKRLWAMRQAVFAGGGLQVAACAAALGLAALAAGLPWQAALVIGLATSLSSTAIAVQLMSERALLPSPMGRSAFGILLFQDIAAIPIIALVPLLGAGTKGGGGIVDAAKIVAVIVLVVVIGRFLTRPALRVVAKSNLREVFTAFALLLVLGIGELVASAGVSMAMGAFLAGVLLASSEYRTALETDIEPFKGLLLGLFFIAVGMSIDFGVLATRPLEVAGAVAALLGLKLLVLRAIAPACGVSRRGRWLFAALLAQGSEFAFVVFGVASQARVLPGDWGPVLTLAVALSMALSPLVVLAAERLTGDEARAPVAADPLTPQDAPILIAGFGRYGQIVGRLLYARGFRATILDHDPDQLDLMRKFGWKVFYGDATRLDLLHTAGAAEARVIVNAIDDVDASLRLAEIAREHFPQATVVARARNVRHYYQLRERGVALIQRETFESALRSARETLEAIGLRPYEAREAAERFRRHNRESLEAIFPHYKDEMRLLSLTQSAREELEKMFERDRESTDREGRTGWH